LRKGATTIKMLGRYHPVRAKIASVELSAHADRSELLDWLGTAIGPQMVYVNHGEARASDALAGVISERLDIPAVVPSQGERVLFDGLVGAR
jgi:metallo-beta-lactamase family protein